MTTGVVVMAYGTPASAEEIESYYTHIRRGRPPSDEQLAELRARYEAIGGLSPLRAITESQRAVIANALGEEFDVRLGYKHAAPFIEDAVAQLPAGTPTVGVVLAPHYSRASIGEYVERLGHPAVESWHDLPEWLDFEADAVRAALASLPARTSVVFTAHSLPERALVDDPYPQQLEHSAREIATRAGVEAWRVAWQSAGRTPEPWRGPDILEVIAGLDADAVLVCPQGFTSDHLEVLYDVDIAARSHAERRGLAFARTEMVNDDATVLGALSERVRSLDFDRDSA